MNLSSDEVFDDLMDNLDRSYALQKIFYLHDEKKYKIETMFTAVYILDTYLATIGHWNFNRENLCLLSTTSVLLAAKFDEPVSPNFKRVIRLLTKEERELITVEDILQME
jgi:hypothetical protein